MAEARMWQLCILCQNQTEKVLPCSLTNLVVSHREGAYTEIISLASLFRAIGAAPHSDIELPDEESMYPSIVQDLRHPDVNLVVSFTRHQHLTMHMDPFPSPPYPFTSPLAASS